MATSAVQKSTVTATAPLTYSSPPLNGAAPRAHSFDPEDPTVPRNNVQKIAVPTRIFDMRTMTPARRDLDGAGFDIVQEPSVMTAADWDDRQKIENVYIPETIELVKRITRSDRAELHHYLVRRRDPKMTSVGNAAGNPQPAFTVHVDASPDFLDSLMKGRPDAAELRTGRVRVINVWRPLNIVLDAPLAICNAKTVDPETDFMQMTLVHPGGEEAQMLGVKPNPKHEWYAPSMQDPDEALVFKTYDNDPNSASLVPHSAFPHPKYYNKDWVKPRESIEVRVLVFGGSS